jgi:hypothetical protein
VVPVLLCVCTADCTGHSRILGLSILAPHYFFLLEIMSSADDRVVTASDEREVDVIPETLPPGSSLPEGSLVTETFVGDSVIHETFQDTYQEYDDLYFPDSPIEECGSIIPDSQGGRLLTDEEVTRIVQRHFLQRKPVA